jgi:hypothetical protein
MMTHINSLATEIIFFNKVTGLELCDGFSQLKQITSKFSYFLVYFSANNVPVLSKLFAFPFRFGFNLC